MYEGYWHGVGQVFLGYWDAAAVALVHLRDWWLTIRPTTNQLQFVDQAENCTPTD
jgi:hypothetical protein